MRRNRLASRIVYLSILLLGAALGLGLAFSVRPEKKSKPNVVYKILIFESPEPKKDFSDHFRLMHLICNPSPVSASADGEADYFSKVFSVQNRLKTSFTTVNNSTSYLTLRYQLDIEGKEQGRNIVTEIIFRKEGRVFKQYISQNGDNLQLLVLDQGPPTTYGIVQLDRNSTMTVSGPNYRPIRRGIAERNP